MLKKDKDFLVFFLNIIIDFRINSVNRAHFTAFLTVYLPIDVSKPINVIAAELHSQLKNFFGGLMLQSSFSFIPTERLINIIPYKTFVKEHLPPGMSVGSDKFYHDYELYISRIKRRGGAKTLKPPYRKYTPDDGTPVQKRIVWLARYDEVKVLVKAYCRLNLAAAKATAYNDILGLGFDDPARPEKKTLLLFLVFPATFNQDCYKPTFIEGPLWEYKSSFFLSTIAVGGYGLTMSTDGGTYEAAECVTQSVNLLTSAFKFGALGYAEAIVNKSNMKDKAFGRLAQT